METNWKKSKTFGFSKSIQKNRPNKYSNGTGTAHHRHDDVIYNTMFFTISIKGDEI